MKVIPPQRFSLAFNIDHQWWKDGGGYNTDRSVPLLSEQYGGGDIRQGDPARVRSQYYWKESTKLVKDTPTVEIYDEIRDYTTLYGRRTTVKSLRHSKNPLDFFTLFPGGYRTNAENESITRALNKLDEDAATLGSDLGEAHQTIDMFADYASQFMRALRAARSGNWGALPGILGMNKRDVLSGKFAANKWLEYQYGWRPLKSNLYLWQQKVHEQLVKDRIIAVKTTVKVSDEDTGPIRGTNIVQKRREEYSARVHLKTKLSNTTLRGLNSWGLLNPASIAWELTPFSFVGDWFVPIGNTLSACTAGFGLEFVDGCTSHRTKRSCTLTESSARSESTRGGNGYKATRTGGSAIAEATDFSRVPFFYLPMGRIYADLTPFSTTRSLNALALLRQLV